MLEKLIELGLREKEAMIYLALLEFDEASVSKIAKQSGINRTTIYDILPDLVRDGFVKRIFGPKTETFKAEPPEKIPLILDKKIRAIQEQTIKAKKLIDQLNLVASKKQGKPKISIFEGKEGIRALYDDTLLTKEIIKSFGSSEILEKIDPEYLNEYYRRRAAKKVFIEAILGGFPTAYEYQKKDQELYREIRIVPPEMMDIKPEVYIYENKTAFFSFEEKFGVLIESKDIAAALKKLHILAWERAAELDKKR
jgi:sugar-specific transcriptional regulator TrmB